MKTNKRGQIIFTLEQRAIRERCRLSTDYIAPCAQRRCAPWYLVREERVQGDAVDVAEVVGTPREGSSL